MCEAALATGFSSQTFGHEAWLAALDLGVLQLLGSGRVSCQFFVWHVRTIEVCAPMELIRPVVFNWPLGIKYSSRATPCSSRV